MPFEVEVVRAPHWSDKRFYIRRVRDRSIVPAAELETRIAFGEAAYDAFEEGMNGVLPPAAEAVKERMNGRTFGEDRRIELDEELLGIVQAAMAKRGITELVLPKRYKLVEMEEEAKKWLAR